jgi:hypothetical protein
MQYFIYEILTQNLRQIVKAGGCSKGQDYIAK